MTPFEIELAKALGRVSGWVGARFCEDMARAAVSKPEDELTLRQRHYMEIMAWRYRRQLPDDLVPHAKPLPMPRAVKPPKPERKKKIDAPPPEPDLFSALGQ
jgi:hypothetical protein